jgi:hypothetical protein
MIREDRELLAALARLGREMAPLALRIMEDSAGIAEQRDYAQRLIAAGEQLRRRADESVGIVVEGEVLINEPLAPRGYTIESRWES